MNTLTREAIAAIERMEQKRPETGEPYKEYAPLTIVGFQMPVNDHDRLKTTAKVRQTSVAQVCREAVTSYLDKLEEESEQERDRR